MSDEFEIIEDKSGRILKKYTGKDTEVVIPDGVTRIDSGVFRGCTSVTSVVIPDGVKEIGWFAFENCPNLTRIEVPEGVVETLGDTFNPISFSSYSAKLITRKTRESISESASQYRTMKSIQVTEEIFKRDIRILCEIYNNHFDVISNNGSVIGRFQMTRHLGIVTCPRDFDHWVCDFKNYYKDTKIQIALGRLCFPYELDDDYKVHYEDFLKSYKKEVLDKLIKDKDVTSINKLAEILITKNNVDALIEKASVSGFTELVAFFLDYKVNRLKVDQKKSKLDVLKPLDPNSYKEIQKEWILADVTEPELTVAGYKGLSKNPLILPSFAGKKPIRTIGYHFTGGSSEMVAPEGYKKIAPYAFSYRSWDLMNLTLPASLVEIGEKAFLKCPNLTIQAPKGSFAVEYAKQNNISYVEL